MDTALAFVRNRNLVTISNKDRFTYEERVIDLQHFLYKNQLRKHPSPAAMQLALLDNPDMNFKDERYTRPEYIKALERASEQLGEQEFFNSNGNAFYQTWPRVYSILESYVLLQLAALKPTRPISHAECIRLYNRAAKTGAGLSFTRTNREIEKLRDAKFVDVKQQMVVNIKFKNNVKEALRFVKSMLEPSYIKPEPADKSLGLSAPTPVLAPVAVAPDVPEPVAPDVPEPVAPDVPAPDVPVLDVPMPLVPAAEATSSQGGSQSDDESQAEPQPEPEVLGEARDADSFE